MIKHYFIPCLLAIFFSLSDHLNAQTTDWGAFEHLMDKTWVAEGKWGDGSPFKQEIQFTFDLEKQLIVTHTKGFTNQEKTKFGARNHGVRQYDAVTKSYRFWEFDILGGVTEGTVVLKDKNLFYQYKYGDYSLTDAWEYVDDKTYKFTVGIYEDGTWKQRYLETVFKLKQ